MSNFDFDSLMKQAQQMQNEMMKIQGELSETIYTGNSGGAEGVTVKMNGDTEVQVVEIADELMDPENKEILQDMLVIAFNDALDKVNSDREEKLGVFSQGAGFPGL